MPADASAYAALGLQPGADREAIERAYKRLIKQHHPDREGGDSARAAEINRAYRELRRPSTGHALEFGGGEAFGRRPSVWTAAAILAAVASLGLVAATALMTPNGSPVAAADRPTETMDQPISANAVDAEIQHALSLSRTEDEIALTAASRDCHQELRREPSLEQLDRCAAFDSAVILLQDRDPLRDRGPFSELAVTSRLMRGGSLLSNDYLATDDRLDQVRLRVELALAPRIESDPPAEAEASED